MRHISKNLTISALSAFLAALPLIFTPAIAQTTPTTVDAPSPQATAEAAQKALQGFEAEVDKIRADWQVPGLSVVITKGTQIIYAKGHGLRDVAKKLPMTADTLLPIGSSTKSFTTAMMAKLVEDGKLDWDKPIRTWLPGFTLQDPLASARMTALDLVTHRSGLPRHDKFWVNSPYSGAEMVRRMQYLEPNKDFRTEFQYNNNMYVVAGHLTEVITGKRWEDNVQAALLTPLGMKRTNFSLAQTQKDANFSQPYGVDQHGKVGLTPFMSVEHIGAAGSINASANEMAAWMIMHLNQGKYQGKQIIGATGVDYLHIPRMLLPIEHNQPELVDIGYAPGWFVHRYRGHLRLNHGGNIEGFTALVTLVPDAQIGITVLSNLTVSEAPGLIMRHAIDRLLALEKRDWSAEALKKSGGALSHQMVMAMGGDENKAVRKTDTRPSHALTDYVGQYEHPAYGVVTVALKDGLLGFAFNGSQTPLEHWHYDTFNGMKGINSPFENDKIQFGLGLAGGVTTLQIEMESTVKPIVFVRRF